MLDCLLCEVGSKLYPPSSTIDSCYRFTMTKRAVAPVARE